ncbi:MAG: Murein DD-endopeptidase MepS/Murein LD-carboxypeptidase precursor [Syntrophorhabdus sp. PtaU1.Bin058]|nr:MAG: Murein DD-endopeptidase MepS/Murein LD-carboxypeptidase precursor [Syntrophorhabdus sp. PtaU1.Bin058]
MRVVSIRILVVFLLMSSLFCCAPKKVKIYESISDIRSNIIQSSASFVGRPYRSGAKGPDAFDCSGFVYYVFKQSGVVLPITAEGLLRMGYQIPRDSVQPGDLVFFKISKDLHIGIMLNTREFIHSSKSRGVTVDDVDSSYWKRNLLSYRTVL